MPTLADALRYPFQGVGRFLIACLALPGITAAGLALILYVALLKSEGGDLGVLFRATGYVVAVSLPVVGLPCALLTGYWLRAIREVSQGATELPRWDRLGQLLGEGLVGMLVGLFLCVAPFALCLWGLVRGSHGQGVTHYVGTGPGLALVLTITALVLVIPPLWPLAMLRVALGRSVPVRWEYGLVLALLYFGHLAVTAVLGWLPFLWLPATVWFQLFAAHLLGQYASSCLRPPSPTLPPPHEREPHAPPSEPPPH